MLDTEVILPAYLSNTLGNLNSRLRFVWLGFDCFVWPEKQHNYLLEGLVRICRKLVWSGGDSLLFRPD
ncbi:hypothetical protein HanXRQr2_Chr15g0684091 [Helianthus annuus]|uniref:Uncharacterized protein n=1 Tax=Helianthus annuus TaxID=4232 RepID=A0A251V0P3_HELAN|nr:hypothetical protein HanXRQr2_Chr15g0684091 [Helianthus annuus]